MIHDLHTVAFFFFNDTATTEIYTLSLHDALPISLQAGQQQDDPEADELPGDHDEQRVEDQRRAGQPEVDEAAEDRKSTRLNSSHSQISYAVFCLKKKKHYKCPSLQSVQARGRVCF